MEHATRGRHAHLRAAALRPVDQAGGDMPFPKAVAGGLDHRSEAVALLLQGSFCGAQGHGTGPQPAPLVMHHPDQHRESGHHCQRHRAEADRELPPGQEQSVDRDGEADRQRRAAERLRRHDLVALITLAEIASRAGAVSGRENPAIGRLPGQRAAAQAGAVRVAGELGQVVAEQRHPGARFGGRAREQPLQIVEGDGRPGHAEKTAAGAADAAADHQGPLAVGPALQRPADDQRLAGMIAMGGEVGAVGDRGCGQHEIG